MKKIFLLITSLTCSMLSFTSEKRNERPKKRSSDLMSGQDESADAQSPAKKQKVEDQAVQSESQKVDVARFWDYVFDGNAEAVTACLQMQPDLKDATNGGDTPLIIAAHNGDLSVVKALVTASANINKACADYDTTPLYLAVQQGNVEIVNILITAGANVNKPNNENVTPLFTAVYNGKAEIVSALIKAGAEVNKAILNGTTILSIAAQQGQTEIVNILIASGAKKENNSYEELLSMAALNGHAEKVRALIAAGADVNQVNSNGEKPLYIAARNGHTTIVQMLIAAGAVDVTKFLDYIWHGIAEAVAACLKMQPDLKDATNDGATPLFIAAQNGQAAVVNVLIAAGAEVNKATTDNGATPLLIAAQNGHATVVQALIAACAEVNQATTDGATPLFIAAQNGHATVVQSLITAGAEVNQARTDGITPLAIACCQNRLPIIRILLGIPTIERNFRNQPWYNEMRNAMTPETQLLVDNDWYGKNQKLFEAIRSNEFNAVSQAIMDVQQKVFVYDRWGINQQTSQESKETKENFELYNTPLHVALKNYAALQKQEEKASCLSIIKALSEADPQLWYMPNGKDKTPLNEVLQKTVFADVNALAPTAYYKNVAQTLADELPDDIISNVIQPKMILTPAEAEDSTVRNKVESK